MEAKQKCPELILVPPNYGLYEKCSKACMDILRQYSPDVEQYSIDEAFVDMTGMEKLWGDPVTAANRLKNQIRDTLGFTVNIEMCIRDRNNGVCSCRKNSRFSYNRRSVFFAAARQSGHCLLYTSSCV